jgi:hypothetical protein
MVLLLLLLCKVMPALTNARLWIQQFEYLGLLARLSDEGEKLFAYLCVVLVDEPEEELALPRKTLVHVVLCNMEIYRTEIMINIQGSRIQTSP